MGIKKGKIRAAEKLYKQRRFREAELAARELVSAQGDSLPLINLLASAVQKQGKYKESEIWFARSLRSDPRQFNATLNQALNKEAQGKHQEAQDLYLWATQLTPGSHFPYLRLGRLNARIENFSEALKYLNEAIRLKPDHAEAYAMAGSIYMQLRQDSRGVDALRRAVELNPALADAQINLGYLLLRHEDPTAAIDRFQAALVPNPDYVPAHLGLGRAYRDGHEIEKAIACYRHALSLDPKSVSALFGLSAMKRYAPGDSDVERMQELMADPDVAQSKSRLVLLGCALAKAYDDCGKYGEACDRYLDAKRLARESEPYSIENDRRFFARVKEVFDAETIAKGRARGLRGHAPIFIAGMPRSGKTSIAEVIGRHPRTFAAPEVVNVGWVVDKLIPRDDGPFDADNVKRMLIEPDPSRAENLARNSARITINTHPGNFWALGAIEMMFPEARIIHCRRDPLSNCLSIFKSRFINRSLGYCNSIDDTVEFFGLYEDLMAHWRSVLATEIHDVRYDDMVAGGETGPRELLEACGLDFAELDGPVPALSLGSYMDNGIVSYLQSSAVGAPSHPDSAAGGRESREMLEAYANKMPALRQWI